MKQLKIEVVELNDELVVRIRIEQILFEEFQKREASYVANLSGKQVNMLLTLEKAGCTFIERRWKRPLEGRNIMIRRQGNIYMVEFYMNKKELIKLKPDESIPVNLKTSAIQLKGTFRIKAKQLNQLIESAKTKKPKSSSAKINKIKQPKFKRNVKGLVEKFDLLEESRFSKEKSNEKILKEKNISLRSPMVNRRCGRCVSFNNNTCMSHQVDVSENHGCKRFHSYKLFRGGGFSPK